MNDMIKRQDAIDALEICANNMDGINCHKCPLRDTRWDGAWYDEETTCYTKLMSDSAKLLEMPSAQPEIIRCKDCKHYDGRPCGIVDWYNTADDFCSKAERRTDE